jgi:hypothetical protein
MTFPKRNFSSKSTKKWLRYHQKNTEKHYISPKNRIKKPLQNNDFFQVSHFFILVLHGSFLERKFDMKERISTCTWDRLGTPPRLKICDF